MFKSIMKWAKGLFAGIKGTPRVKYYEHHKYHKFPKCGNDEYLCRLRTDVALSIWELKTAYRVSTEEFFTGEHIRSAYRTLSDNRSVLYAYCLSSNQYEDELAESVVDLGMFFNVLALQLKTMEGGVK